MSQASDQPSEPVAAPPQPAPSQPAGQQQQQVQVDSTKVACSYVHFCRVTGTPEELIIDFGLNAQPFGVPTEPVTATQRIVTNFFTAKRMLHALAMTIERHEAAFGSLEIDVQKRINPGWRG